MQPIPFLGLLTYQPTNTIFVGTRSHTMAVATQQISSVPLDGALKSNGTVSGPKPDNKVVTVTDLLLSKVRTTPDAIFIRYPATAKGRNDYVGFSVTDIDRLADEAARQYARRGLKPEVRYLGTIRRW